MISDEHKAIFIHIPKTGGTSFNEIMSPSDSEITTASDFSSRLKGSKGDHLDARESRALHGSEKWNEYFKFAFIRNPWDLIVSLYFWEMGVALEQINNPTNVSSTGETIAVSTHRLQPNSFLHADEGPLFRKINDPSALSDFNQFLDNLAFEYDGYAWSQVRYLIDRRGKIDLDFIGRFESFSEDAEFVLSKLKIESEIPHLNKSEHEHYSKYYDEQTKKKVGEMFKEDIRYFEYEFSEE